VLLRLSTITEQAAGSLRRHIVRSGVEEDLLFVDDTEVLTLVLFESSSLFDDSRSEPGG